MIYIKRVYLVLLAVIFGVLSVFSVHTAVRSVYTAAHPMHTSRKTVVIDAGHGGVDAGTIGIDGTNEKDINLAIAFMLYDYLMVSGIQCVLIRDGDYEVYFENYDRSRSDLYNRMDVINAVPDAVLISIHQNHFEDEREWGTQVWYSANTPESKVMADGILSSVKELLQPDNQRENKQSDSGYYLLYKATVPSVMIECGFMSNAKENEQLNNSDYQKEFAYAVLVGICGEV